MTACCAMTRRFRAEGGMNSAPSERRLGAGRHFFDDIRVGDQFETGSVEVTAGLIRSYAELSGDRYQLHLDNEAAKDLGFPALIAHGILIQGLADGLKFQSPVQLDAVASLGWDIKFTKPVFAGERISAEIQVKDKRVTSRGDRGVATLDFTIRNQDGVTVQHGLNRLMMRRRPPEER